MGILLSIKQSKADGPCAKPMALAERLLEWLLHLELVWV